MTDDMALLRDYVRENSEDAFAAILSRHVNLVYSVALRQVGDTHLAEEITQVVFIILARKAASLNPNTILSGWLLRTARFTSARALQSRQRRERRELEACMQSLTDESTDHTWVQIAPLLEAGMAKLTARDHDALTLRFFENQDFPKVGAALGISEEAARKRVNRAVDKLRKFFARRGIALSAVAIAAAVSANSVQAAPGLVTNSVAAAAMTKGAAVTGSTLALMKGALKLLLWQKAKTAIIVAVVAILTAGSGVVAIELHRNSADYARAGWRYWQARRLDAATEMFSKAVELDPKNEDAWSGLGWSRLGAGNEREAEKSFQAALALKPESPIPLNGLGQLYLSRGDYAQAELYLLKAAPNVFAAWDGLAQLYLLQGRFGEAETWAQKVVDSGQGDRISQEILQAAKDKKLPDKLRTTLEPKK